MSLLDIDGNRTLQGTQQRSNSFFDGEPDAFAGLKASTTVTALIDFRALESNPEIGGG